MSHLSMRSLFPPPTLASNLISSPRPALISSFGRKNVSFSLQPRSIRLKISCAAQPLTIFERVRKVVSDQLNVDVASVTASSTFAGDLAADSLDTVELIMALEEEFDIEITDETAQKITTVQGVVDFIEMFV